MDAEHISGAFDTHCSALEQNEFCWEKPYHQRNRYQFPKNK